MAAEPTPRQSTPFGTGTPSAPGWQTYVVPTSAAGTKTDTPLVETSRAVSVITRRELEDRGVQSMPEAVRYTAGVTTGFAGFDPRFDQISIRGFSATTIGDYRDGLRQEYGGYATFRTEPYGLDRIDIIKGPASVLYGQINPGGIVDRISKMPTAEPFRELVQQVGQNGRVQNAFDLSGPATPDKTVLYRLVGVVRAGETSYDIADKRLYLAPSLTFAPTPDTTLTILGHVQRDETDSNVAFINRNGRPTRVRSSDAYYDHQKQNEYQIGYRFEHRFSDMFIVRQNLRYGAVDLNSRYLAGAGGFVSPSSTIYRRNATRISNSYDTFAVDNQIESNISTGPFDHKILAGIDRQAMTTRFGLGFLPDVPALAIDIANPRPGVLWPSPTITSRNRTTTDQTGLYLQDQISLDRWRLTLGLRQDYANRTQTDTLTGVRTADRNDERMSYNAGLLYLFDSGFAPYVSYATSFQPVSNLGLGNRVLPPSFGEQMEAGFKWQPKDGPLSATVSVFDLVERNSPALAGTDPASGLLYYESMGKIRNRGVEVEVKGSLGHGFDVTGAYTYVESEIKGSRNVAELGKVRAATPEHGASVWLNHTVEYGPLRGFGIGIGGRYTGDSFANNLNTLKNPIAGFFDAAIRYDLGAAHPKLAGLSAQVSATNLLNEQNVVCDAFICYRGQDRQVMGTLRYRW